VRLQATSPCGLSLVYYVLSLLDPFSLLCIVLASASAELDDLFPSHALGFECLRPDCLRWIVEADAL
jgi:hypothetical protein